MSSKRQTPSDSQREAIEAESQTLLVLAGPGAGKTFCLIERIRFLISERGIDPARICAFAFTNKAAGEIETRLREEIGESAEKVKTGTIHAFCADVLREFGESVGVRPGFGIADDAYQLEVLRRVQPGGRKYHKYRLADFSKFRLRGIPLRTEHWALLEGYERYLARHNQLDFDLIIAKAAEVLAAPVADRIRAQWDVVLVDEFQDLNPIQYRIVRQLVGSSGQLFAVGDDEQSVYGWNGADPEVFNHLLDDFPDTQKVYLGENYRCARQIFSAARRLMIHNPTLFTARKVPEAARESDYPVEARTFEDESDETEWIVADIQADTMTAGVDPGEVAILYRRHEMAMDLETAFINAGIPCRLASGKAFADDEIVAHLIGALRVIAFPADGVHRDAFFAAMMPRRLFHELRAHADALPPPPTSGEDDRLRRVMNAELTRRQESDPDSRHIRRALGTWRNLTALGRRHASLDGLAAEILSSRVGEQKTILEDRHDELSDPAGHPDVVRLAARLADARENNVPIRIERQGGTEIALKGMLEAAGYVNVSIGKDSSAGAGTGELIGARDTPSLGPALGLFKAIQLNASAGFSATFSDYTVIDIETTDIAPDTAEVVELAAVRVRDGRISDEFQRLVKPVGPIHSGASEVHGISAAEVADAGGFEEVWPEFHRFCGENVIVAHNGRTFDFFILQRMAKGTSLPFDFVTFDTMSVAEELVRGSRSLREMAINFGIETGRSHRALDDCRALFGVFEKLRELQAQRARKTALGDVLDYLGLALWLGGDPACEEGALLKDLLRVYPFGRYSPCLEYYEREQHGDETVRTADEIIEMLGGAALMARMREQRSADERYPATMLRLRALLAGVPKVSLDEQIRDFLGKAALTRFSGADAGTGRVNLLTLHATKGLEFSRVYIIGVEDRLCCWNNKGEPLPPGELAESRRLIYVGMTRAKDRLVITRTRSRGGKPTGGHQFIDELGIELTEL